MIFAVTRYRYKKMKIDLYTPAGWINVHAIAERPTWLKVFIGIRQSGKTYGVLLHHLINAIPFILMRRTTDELNFIADNEEYDPFKKFEPAYHVRIATRNKSRVIADIDNEGKILEGGKTYGVALSLPQIAHIRGFDASNYDSLVFDEFVPEKGVRVLHTEGDMLLNAYTTISGNRELEGKPPLTLWMLANTNNINSPILDALDLTDEIIKMKSRGTEYAELDGVSIFYGKSEQIAEKRKQTVLAKRVKPTSNFAQMAYNNEWAYDESPVIRTRSLKGMTPLCSYDQLYFWEDAAGIYCCGSVHRTERYNDNDFERAQFTSNYRWLLRWYAEGLVNFANIRQLAIFKRIFAIDY